MSAPVQSVEQVAISKPCDVDWDSMVGNDQIRSCSHCNLQVNNLSAMTRSQVMRLVARSHGRLCVRFIQAPGGGALVKAPEKLYRLSRNVSRIAAGAFSATLSLASAAAQTRYDPVPGALRQPQNITAHAANVAEGGSISGTVRDSAGALVSGATVTLSNPRTNLAYTYLTTDEGLYQFSLLESGSYQLMADAPTFAPPDPVVIQLGLNARQTIDLVLRLPVLTPNVVEVTSLPVIEVQSFSGTVAVRVPAHPLIQAAYGDDLKAVAELVPTTTDINASDELTDTSALAYAVQNHNLEIVHLLLSGGANPNSINSRGVTPLMYLNASSTIELVRTLTAAGASVNAQDETGDTPLLRAAGACNLSVVKELIDTGARLDARDSAGNTALMNAAPNDDLEVIKLLIKSGLNINAKNEEGESAVAIAVEAGKGETLKVLVDAGAEVNLTKEQINDALASAVRNDDLSSMKIFLKSGADPNTKASEGTTLLMMAAENGKTEVIKALIETGAEIDTVDGNGWTAMMHADDVENVRVLINAGADLTIRNKDGLTALGMALKYDQEEIAKLLRSRGAPE